mmetsp:Transcript_44282/g.71196  ORF Transcript_44282/g.71196 Transcript_44282/m.71196 type:complete len:94 (+) Transcript_44282:1014-1295(+)
MSTRIKTKHLFASSHRASHKVSLLQDISLIITQHPINPTRSALQPCGTAFFFSLSSSDPAEMFLILLRLTPPDVWHASHHRFNIDKAILVAPR